MTNYQTTSLKSDSVEQAVLAVSSRFQNEADTIRIVLALDEDIRHELELLLLTEESDETVWADTVLDSVDPLGLRDTKDVAFVVGTEVAKFFHSETQPELEEVRAKVAVINDALAKVSAHIHAALTLTFLSKPNGAKLMTEHIDMVREAKKVTLQCRILREQERESESSFHSKVDAKRRARCSKTDKI